MCKRKPPGTHHPAPAITNAPPVLFQFHPPTHSCPPMNLNFSVQKKYIYILTLKLYRMSFILDFLIYMLCNLLSYTVMSDSLQPHGLWPSRFLCLWNFLGKSIGVSCHFLLQGIFPTQGLNPHLLTSLAVASGFFTTSAIYYSYENCLTPRDTPEA